MGQQLFIIYVIVPITYTYNLTVLYINIINDSMVGIYKTCTSSLVDSIDFE